MGRTGTDELSISVVEDSLSQILQTKQKLVNDGGVADRQVEPELCYEELFQVFVPRQRKKLHSTSDLTMCWQLLDKSHDSLLQLPDLRFRNGLPLQVRE